MCVLPKNLSKIAAAPQTAVMADNRNSFLPSRQHLTGFLQAVSLYILYGRHMQTVLEHSETLPFTQVCCRCKLRNRNFLLVMLMNVYHHQLYLIIGFVMFSFFLTHGAGQSEKH